MEAVCTGSIDEDAAEDDDAPLAGACPEARRIADYACGPAPEPCRRSMRTTPPLVLSSVLVAALCGCADDIRPTEPPAERPSDPALGAAIDVDALRASLSTAMATGRTLPYDAAWTVLADAHSVGDDGIRLFYTRRVIPAANRASGADQAEPDHWNREHLWPQSYGLRGSDARTDLHNLVPVDRTVNSSRGAKYFDEVSGAHAECTLCEVSTRAWEPSAEVKGDVARAAFYMDVRHEGGADDDVPDLALGDAPSAPERRFGRLSTLLRWHCEDPVSSDEARRHDIVATAQGNRNAFVDVPALVGDVYGTACPDG